MTEVRQRQPRIKDDGFLKFTRTLPCCVCGAIGRSQAAHIRMGNLSLGKEMTGRGKPSDRFVTPLCGPVLGIVPPMIGCHAEQHTMNEKVFWHMTGLDPFIIAALNYARYGAKQAWEGKESPSERKPRKAARPRKRSQRSVSAKPSRKIAKRASSWPKDRKLKGRKFQ